MMISNKALDGVTYQFSLRFTYILPRLTHRVSVKEIAEHCDVSCATIYRLRRGATDVSIGMLLKVADALGINYSFTVKRVKGKTTFEYDIESATVFDFTTRMVRTYAAHQHAAH